MPDDNGQLGPGDVRDLDTTIAKLDRELGNLPVLNPDLLTPRDLTMAREALPGMDVAKMLGDNIDMITLTIFCLRRRDDPEFSWDDALDTPMSEFSQPEPAVPPQIQPLDSSGKSGTTPSGNGPKPKQPRQPTARRSAPSSR